MFKIHHNYFVIEKLVLKFSGIQNHIRKVSSILNYQTCILYIKLLCCQVDSNNMIRSVSSGKVISATQSKTIISSTQVKTRSSSFTNAKSKNDKTASTNQARVRMLNNLELYKQ